MGLSSASSTRTLSRLSKSTWTNGWQITRRIDCEQSKNKITMPDWEQKTTRSLDNAALNAEREEDRRCGQEGGRRTLKFAHGDVPLCVRRRRNNDLVQQHDPLRNRDDDDEDSSIAPQTQPIQKEKGNSTDAQTKQIWKSWGGGSKEAKNEIGSKDLKRQQHELKKQKQRIAENDKGITFVVIQKNVRSQKSSDRIEEIVREVEGCKWDALLLCENMETVQSWDMGVGA